MALSKNFEPSSVEEKWYKHWKNYGYLNSKPDDRPAYSIVIPPPNVTGVLHMGHTLNETIQDILARRARMRGFNVCWVPGSDHASIATEAKVVQMLHERGIQKKDLSREDFLKYAFEWKEKYGGIIYHQLEKLGCSVDWNRVTFTMDDHYYKAVIKTFVKLYREGLIYRGARMINWDVVAKTALSDEEVEYQDQKGHLYHVKYKIAGTADEYLTIATQRPETIMGDVAVCVNPNDERYKNLKGKKVIVPLVNREVPVIFDPYVDIEFGTGVLKITPAHDINDFNIGLKHHLPVIDTLNDDGTLSKEAEVFVGMDRFEAREKVVEALKDLKLLIKEEEYDSRIGYSQRTHSVVEPKISTQWFVKMSELAKPALDAVVNRDIKIHPYDRFIATYKYWLENVKDWCISRQLWWGQQIPAWYDEEGHIFVGKSESAVREFYALGNQVKLTQDKDVLDTWFSSWLWPLEVFKGISQPGNEDFKYYYPTSVLVTGQDIIFFWVARMIMAGLKYEDKKPFNDVYFTGMVRDKLGRKMSKSLGNSPDLLKLIEEFGADAVRFGIMISSPAGNDLLFDESSLEQGRHFNNKIWNALKLIKMWEGHEDFGKGAPAKEHKFAIEWFRSRLSEACIRIENLSEDYKLSEALKVIYSLIKDDYCSWYLEWVKPPYGEAMCREVFDQTIDFFDELLQMLHPYMPFVTEEIYHKLKSRKQDLMVSQVQQQGEFDKDILKIGNHLQELIAALRDARNKYNLGQKSPISICISTENEEDFEIFGDLLKKQVFAENIDINREPEEKTIQVVAGNEKLLIIAKEDEINLEEQKNHIEKDLQYMKGFLNSVEKKLSNENFVSRAKPEIVNREIQKKNDAIEKIKVLEESLKSLI